MYIPLYHSFYIFNAAIYDEIILDKYIFHSYLEVKLNKGYKCSWYTDFKNKILF